MYSRSTGRDGRWYDPDDIYDEESEDEYELYKYDLPPRYDGSRFRGHVRGKHEPDTRRTRASASYGGEMRSTADENECAESADSGPMDDGCGPPSAKALSSTERRGILPELGREELLLITIILILSAEGEVDMGTILLLLVLLTQ